MDRLIVKNFGPLKDVDIELNKINLFIGENGSGKSVLAKLITLIINSINKGDINYDYFKQKLNNYIISFLSDNTYIKYYDDEYEEDNQIFTFVIKGSNLYTNNNLLNLMLNEEEVILNDMIEHNLIDALEDKNSDIMLSLNDKVNSICARYIPAERNLISIFNKSTYTFLTVDIPIPKFLITFFSGFEQARNNIKKLSFLNVKYVNKDNKNIIYYNKDEFLDLEHSSSGIQSALPLYLTIKYFAQKYGSILIEEPEQNLFPKAQKETVEYIIEQLEDKNRLFMMTHSPYILTALNNLILANDVKNQKGLEAIDKIVKESQCVAFEDVRAYNIVDGRAIDIMDIEDRLIGVNLIDSISDEVNHTFDTLLSKLD